MMAPDDALRAVVSGALVRLTARSPFLASLALFAKVEASEQVPTAATDGQNVYFNPAFMEKLSPNEVEAVLLHEVLHAALLHVGRRGMREAERWNIAADIVVNGILAREGYDLPKGAVRDAGLERYSAEEVYDLLARRSRQRRDKAGQGGEQAETGQQRGKAGSSAPGTAEEQAMPGLGDLLEQPPADARPGDAPGGRGPETGEHYWRSALQQVKAGLKSTVHGTVPGDLARELGQAEGAQLDWRAYLWRFLVQTPVDFEGFDRRFVGRRMYLETLAGERVRVYIAVDTSGSIDRQALSAFMDEVDAIRAAYPHLECQLYYADTRLHGPYLLDRESAPPVPKGGGGTDFRPFLAHLEAQGDTWTPAVAIYLTDGYGRFPERAPDVPMLWVITPGGLALEKVPFGEAVRLVR
jgi:predicted metal-dependent peptidase